MTARLGRPSSRCFLNWVKLWTGVGEEPFFWMTRKPVDNSVGSSQWKDCRILFLCLCSQGSAESASWRSFSGSAATPQVFSLWIFGQQMSGTNHWPAPRWACSLSVIIFLIAFGLSGQILPRLECTDFQPFYDEKRIALFLFGTGVMQSTQQFTNIFSILCWFFSSSVS